MTVPTTSPLTGRRVLVYCGGSSWDAPPGTDRHLATHLADRIPVIYVDPPDSVVWQARHRRRPTLRPGFEQVGDELYRLTPRALPGVTRPGLRELAHAGTRRTVRRLVALHRLDVGAQVVASLDDLFGACHTDRRVIYGTDDFVAGADLMGISRTWVERREPRALATATHVLAVSDVIAERWRSFGYAVTGAAQRLRHRDVRGHTAGSCRWRGVCTRASGRRRRTALRAAGPVAARGRRAGGALAPARRPCVDSGTEPAARRARPAS